MNRNAMEQDLFNLYLKEVSRRAPQLAKSPDALNDLLQVIESHAKEPQQQPNDADFFDGEKAFYSGHYEIALKHYLKATLIPQFHFFCYRTSAYLFHQLGNVEKAMSFVQKALKIASDDYMTLVLQEKLLADKGPKEEHLAVQMKIRELENDKDDAPSSSNAPKPFGEKAMEELAQIFEEHPAEENVLFAKEFNPSPLPQNPPVTDMEPPMNTESDIFSSPKSHDSTMTQVLTQRLYPAPAAAKDPFLKPTKSSSQPFEELKKLALGTQELSKECSTAPSLEQCIKQFQLSQTEHILEYLNRAKNRTALQDSCLYYLNGWHATPATPYTPGRYLTEASRKMAGGLFLRWNGKGIAINPGLHFMEAFHAQGLHIRDIDIVLVTSDAPEAYADVKQLYELSYQLNKVSPDLHIIHYYFNQSAYQELSRLLKPHFKQERETLHSLELFMDSPDVEKVEIAEGVILHYFLTTATDVYASKRELKEESAQSTNLGIRLELKSPTLYSQDKAVIRVGYIANTAWNPLLAHHLGSCDLLITGFGNTSSNDVNKLSYNGDSLGYYGSYTLFEEVAPRLMLCGEFGGREGDIRLEVAQKMRHEYVGANARPSRHAPIVLPADTGLVINLKTMQVQCSVTQGWVDPVHVRTTKTCQAFGKLVYLSSGCIC